MNIVVIGLGAAALVAATAAQLLRWLRVLQREHYEPAALLRFLKRWSSPSVGVARPVDRKEQRPITLTHVCLVIAIAGLALHQMPIFVGAAVVYGLWCPQGLSIKGRTSSLVWTRRLRMVAGLSALLLALIAVFGLALPSFFAWQCAAVIVWAVPLVIDLSARLLAPFERRHAQRFVETAAERLRRVSPRVVAITGSYGKTSTKHHLADLFREDGGVVATPKSFNNRAGLSRAINEGLTDGTRVFVAEMGTYGPGEIAELCAWCPPSIAVITAIGPVHLERMGSLDVIESAKFEITEQASTVIVNIDDERLATWPTRLSGKRVRTAGSRREADVRVVLDGDAWHVDVEGTRVASVPAIASLQATNVACALATALELGLGVNQIASRLASLTPVANRATVVTAPSGVVVIDDTFNANPASAAASLRLLTSLNVPGRRVVVTPGMIELGDEQYGENARFAHRVAEHDVELVVVNKTNAVALRDGYEAPVRRFDVRDDAVAWVRASLKAGDAVLYLNDLPDHYP